MARRDVGQDGGDVGRDICRGSGRIRLVRLLPSLRFGRGSGLDIGQGRGIDFG